MYHPWVVFRRLHHTVESNHPIHLFLQVHYHHNLYSMFRRKQTSLSSCPIKCISRASSHRHVASQFGRSVRPRTSRGGGGSIHRTALGPSPPFTKSYLFAERPIEDGGLVSNPVINYIYGGRPRPVAMEWGGVQAAGGGERGGGRRSVRSDATTQPCCPRVWRVVLLLECLRPRCRGWWG